MIGFCRDTTLRRPHPRVESGPPPDSRVGLRRRSRGDDITEETAHRQRKRGSSSSLVLLIVWALSCRVASAQHYLEVRLADPQYRFLDWNYTFSNSAIVDVFYVGVPGSNEINLGGGFGFKPSRWFTVAPLAYAVFDAGGDQRGVKLAVLAGFEKDGWKASAFLGCFARISGDVGNYQVLDSLDATRAIGAHFELGISSGFFHADEEWNPLLGPLVRWNDRLGCWALAYRFGDENELRATRVFILDKSKAAP